MPTSDIKIRCKPGVNPYGAHPKVKYMTLVVAQAIYHEGGGKECVVTSICDGRHRWNSFHYLLGAADYRSKHLSTEEKRRVLQWVRNRLGNEFDFVLEHEGEVNEHFHGEWDDGAGSRQALQERLRRKQRDWVQDILDPNKP